MTTTVAADGVVLGEVHSGMLRSSKAISPAATLDVLALTYGERVRSYERPVQYAVSPERLTGVDCVMPTSSGARVRGVGTALSRAMITGGHILQASAFTNVVISTNRRRMGWSHYLARPGVIELIGGRPAAQLSLADGFLAGNWAAEQLDLGAIAIRAMESAQRHDRLDHRVPFQTSRATLRWAMGPTEGGPTSIVYALTGSAVRTVRLPRIEADVRAVARFLEDLALHDWLLSTLLSVVARSQIGGVRGSEVVSRLKPAVDFLLHLWMPAARMDNQLTALWEGVERRPGLSRQWRVTVDRIRDQVALAQLETAGQATT
jgi:hypothetical protein